MKLTRKASVLLFTIALIIVSIIGYHLLPEKKDESVHSYLYEMLMENADIEGYGKIINDNGSNKYQEFKVSVSKAAGYTLTNKQTFTKYLQFTGANNTYIDGKSATSMAYSLVLRGDVVRVIDQNTKEKKIILVNVSITYDRIPIYMNDKQDTVYYKNNGEVKSMTLTRFKRVLSDPLMRKTILA